MDDLISRQAAIDAIEEMQMPIMRSELPKEQLVFTGMSEALRAIKNLPSAQQWIPCSERLPEESDTYIVSGQWSSGRASVGECYYSTEDRYFDAAWNFDVKAWMPLPEPWKGESDG